MSSQQSGQDEKQIKEILRAYLNARRYPPALEQARNLSNGIDWHALVQAASGEFIIPLLWRNLKASLPIPTDIAMLLQSIYLETAQLNLLKIEALRGLLDRLSERKIEPILLKGLAIAEIVYGNIAVRPSRDIDLLIRREEIPAALECAADMGFDYYKLPEHPQTAIEFENEILLYKPERNIFLELHWSLFDSPYYQRMLDLEWFREHTSKINIGEASILAFCLESNLIYLCGHMAFHHKGNELLWLNDIAELIYQYKTEIDWPMILEKAGEFQLILPLRITLSHVATDWYAPIPADVLAAFQNAPVTSEETQIFSALSGERMTSGKHFWTDLKGLDGTGKRFNYAIQVIFPSFSYMRQRYAISRTILIPLYYPYRWWLGVSSFFTDRKNAADTAPRL